MSRSVRKFALWIGLLILIILAFGWQNVKALFGYIPLWGGTDLGDSLTDHDAELEKLMDQVERGEGSGNGTGVFPQGHYLDIPSGSIMAIQQINNSALGTAHTEHVYLPVPGIFEVDSVHNVDGVMGITTKENCYLSVTVSPDGGSTGQECSYYFFELTPAQYRTYLMHG